MLRTTLEEDPRDSQWPSKLRFNVAPSQTMPVVRLVDGRRQLRMMRWGLRSPLARADDGAFSNLLINARLETLREKSTFRDLLVDHRCLVPADGFYEWRGSGRHKTPWLFAQDGDRPFAFAGLWGSARKGDAVVEAFVIVTRAPDDVVAAFHDRMPLILRPEEHARWLGDGGDGGSDAVDLDAFAGERSSGLTVRPASLRLGNTDNDDADVLLPPLTLF